MLLLAASPAYAANTGQADGQPNIPALPANAGDISVTGNAIVWYEPDAKGFRQIHYADLHTGETRVVTDSETRKEAPMISGSKIVWMDKAGVPDPSSYWWSIISYDLNAGEMNRINSLPGIMVHPSISGNDVVWYDTLTNNMYHYNLSSNVETRIGQGVLPQVSGGKVVYKTLDGELGLLTLASGAKRTLVKPADGITISQFVSNGEYVVWNQSSAVTNQKVVMLSLKDVPLVTRDLTFMEKKAFFSTYLTIGNQTAAWIEERGGKAVLAGADLRTGLSFVIDRQPGESLYPFWGDQLLYGRDGKLNTRTIVPLNPPISSGSDQSGDSPTADSIEQRIGPKGGQLELSDGTVKLIIPEGALERDTLVSIKRMKDADALRNKLTAPRKLSVDPIEIASELPFAIPATLEMRYDRGGLTATQQMKLGIYAFNAKTEQWSYLGTHVNQPADKVTGTIAGPGSFAALLNDISFADMTGHWSRENVEILASRGIVEGMTNERFTPDQTLTRAQFAKLLVGAMGGKPLFPGKSSFQDVSADYWGYGWIEAAAQAGLVEGDGVRFAPEEPLTREQMITMLVRAAGGAWKTESPDAGADEAQLAAYGDQDRISNWARAYVAQGVKLNLVEGDQGKLMPEQFSTRAQAAAVIYRFMTKQNKL